MILVAMLIRKHPGSRFAARASVTGLSLALLHCRPAPDGPLFGSVGDPAADGAAHDDSDHVGQIGNTGGAASVGSGGGGPVGTGGGAAIASDGAGPPAVDAGPAHGVVADASVHGDSDPRGDGGGLPPKPPGASRVKCGSVSCDAAAGEVCCLTVGIAGSVLACTTSPDTCTSRYGCDADNDCPEGQTCCAATTPLAFSGNECRTSCPGGAIPLRCSEPDDCPGGTCCATSQLGALPPLGTGTPQYTEFACAPSCPAGRTKMCDAKTPCATPARCQANAALPAGYLACL